MESPKIVIEIPKSLNKKIKVLQELTKKINHPVPSKQEVITAILTYETEWIDQRIEVINQAVQAVAKV